MFLNNRNSQSGQVLLIVVLVMVVSLTIGLSVISRSITNVRTSTEEANSAQALAAAEAGIQKSISENVSSSGSFAVGGTGYNSTFDTDVTSATVDNFPLNGGNVVLMNEGIDLWLVPHDPSGVPDYGTRWNGTLNIFWGKTTDADDCDEAALEMTVIKGWPETAITSSHYLVDPCSTRITSNSFSLPNFGPAVYTAGNKQFRFKHQLPNIAADGLVVRIIPLYFDAAVGVSKDSGPIPIPSQGSILDSTGSSGEVKRKINVFQGYSFLPVEFASYGILRPSNE